MDYNKKFMFSAAGRGFHLYRRAWVPTESEKLKCAHDKNKPFDDFAIKTMRNSGQAVGHLPIELTQITKFLIDRGAEVEAQLSSVIYGRSPLTIQNQQKTNVPTNNKKKADKKKPVSSYDLRSLLSDSRPNVIKTKIIEIDLIG